MNDDERLISTHPRKSKNSRLPGPRGAPFAWAESRQELCETLTYYRSFHSGCYKVTSKDQKGNHGIIRDSVPYGYLLAGFGASRDAWQEEGRVIISHGGGKSGAAAEEEEASGVDNLDAQEQRVKANGDQTLQDGQISSLVHSYQCQTPIVLLMAKDYKLSHFELPCAFAVLGWYCITDIWCEREPSKDPLLLGWVRWKFRFQYIQSQGQPWWLGDDLDSPCWNPQVERVHRITSQAKEDSKVSKATTSITEWTSKKHLRSRSGLASRPTHLTSVPIIKRNTRSSDIICKNCQQSSPLVFQTGWMCLSQGCDAFWKLSNGSAVQDKLQFNPDFMKLRTEPLHFAHGGMPFSLLPPSALNVNDDDDDQGDLMRGLHCMCGRLTCRKYNHYWHCAHCDFIKPCQTASWIHKAPLIDSFSGLELSKIHSSSGIQSTVEIMPFDNLAVTSFYFPEELGKGQVHLIESIDGRQAEADRIFEAMQEGPTYNSKADQYLIPHYSHQAIPFRRHPLSCHAVKGELLSQQFTCNYGVEYKHSVKMDTILLDEAPFSITKALNLIKERTRKVISMGDNDDFNEIYPVKYHESQRMNFHDDGEPGLGPTVSTLSLGIEAKMSFRLKEKYVHTLKRAGNLLKEDNSDAKGITVDNRTLLTLRLRHGCIIIQHGRRLQEMIEHAVFPQMDIKQRGDNCVRIAVTARRIDKCNVKVTTKQSKKRKASDSVMNSPVIAGTPDSQSCLR